MTHAEKYLTFYGKLTKEQENIIKNSFGYQRALLADAVDDLKNELKKEFIRILKFWKRK